MEKIVILDYSVGDVHVYDLPKEVSAEEFMDKSEHKTSECSWMTLPQEFNIIIH